MSTIVHDTLHFGRRLAHPPPVVFEAYADIDQRQAWSAPSADEVVVFGQHDFRVGGTDEFVCGLRDDPGFAGTTRYQHIEDGRLVVYTERLTTTDVALLAVSLVTWSITPDGDGALLSITDQVTSVVGDGPVEGSRHGHAAMLDQLTAHLAGR